MSAESFRRARAELRWGAAGARCTHVKGRSVHQYWALLSPYFRDVLLPPHRRIEGDGVYWEWEEAEDARPPSPRELREVRRRLELERELLEENLGHDAARRGGESGGDELSRGMRTVTAELIGRDDAALGQFAVRTRSGVRLHSWGCETAAEVTYPDAPAKPAAKATGAGGANPHGPARKAWRVAGVALLLGSGLAVWTWRKGEAESTPPETAAARGGSDGRAEGPGLARNAAGSLAQRAAEWAEQERGRAAAEAKRAESAGRVTAAAAGVAEGTQVAASAFSAEPAALPHVRPEGRPPGVGAPPPAPLNEKGGGAGAQAGTLQPAASERAKDGNGPEARGERSPAARKPDNGRSERAAERAAAVGGAPAGVEVEMERRRGAGEVEAAREIAARPAKPERPDETEGAPRASEAAPPTATSEGDGTSHGKSDAAARRAAAERTSGEFFVGEWIGFGAWRPRLLVDEILPTRPEKDDGTRSARDLAARIAAERRAALPAELNVAAVRSGLEFAVAGADAAALRWRGPGNAGAVGGNVEYVPTDDGVWRLARAGTGELVAWVQVEAGRWRVWAGAGVRVRAWLAGPAAWAWRTRELEALPVGWEERVDAGVRRVAFPFAAAKARAIALFDRASGWALVSEIVSGPEDARTGAPGR